MTESATSEGDAPRGHQDERLSAASEQASQAVRQAAEILQSELSGGIEETRRLQRRFTENRRLEEGDLDEVASRVRRSAHQLIDMLSERFRELGAQDIQDLAGRFGKDAHEVLDGVMDLVDSAPEVVNRIMERLDAPTDRATDPAAEAPEAPKAAGDQ